MVIQKDDWDYICEIPAGDQIVRMGFEAYNFTLDTIHYNINLVVYTKRKKMYEHFDHKDITGLRPHATIVAMRQAFEALLDHCLRDYLEYYNILIGCYWLDTRRRNMYYRFLSRYGFRYGRVDGQRLIFRKYKKGEYNYEDDNERDD